MTTNTISLQTISADIDNTQSEGGVFFKFVDLVFTDGGVQRYEIGYTGEDYLDDHPLVLVLPDSGIAKIDFNKVGSYSLATE